MKTKNIFRTALIIDQFDIIHTRPRGSTTYCPKEIQMRPFWTETDLLYKISAFSPVVPLPTPPPVWTNVKFTFCLISVLNAVGFISKNTKFMYLLMQRYVSYGSDTRILKWKLWKCARRTFFLPLPSFEHLLEVVFFSQPEKARSNTYSNLTVCCFYL